MPQAKLNPCFQKSAVDLLVAACAFFLTLASASMAFAGGELQQTNIENVGLQNTKTLALTFDDGPGVGTGRILEALKKYGVHATFFSVGQMAKYHPAMVDRIVSEGHLLANHSFDHDDLSKGIYGTNPELLLKEIKSTHEILAPHMVPGQKLYFRAPYSAWRTDVAESMNQDPILREYIGPISWNVGKMIARDEKGDLKSAADWACWRKGARGLSVDDCLKGYLAEIETNQGGVVLMHDIHAQTAEMFEKMLPILVERGYKFVRLDQIPMLESFRDMRPLNIVNGKPENF